MSIRLELCFKEFLSQIGEDSKRLEKTPFLAARAFEELTQGYALDPRAILEREKIACDYPGTLEIPSIALMSLCEHTFLPFLGTVNIGYKPKHHIAGAGVFKKLVEAYSQRLQLQEPLTAQIADLIFCVLEPQWVQVDIQARHCCMKGQEMRSQVILGQKYSAVRLY